jgi:hypothetical protein
MKFPGKRLIVEYKNRRARKDAGSLWGDIDLKAIARAVDEDDPATPASSVAHPTSSVVKQPPLRVRGKRPPLSAQPAVSSQPPKSANTATVSSDAKRRPVVLNDIAREASGIHRKAEKDSQSVKPVKEETPVSAKPSEGAQIVAVPLVPATQPLLTSERKAVDDGLTGRTAEVQSSVNQSAAEHPSESGPVLGAKTPLAQKEKIADTAKKPRRNSSKTVLRPQRDASVPAVLEIAPDADNAEQAANEPASAVITNDTLAALTAENVRLKKLLTKQLRLENQKLKQMLVRTD